jgi:flagellin-like hook-associated protein FlgL
MSVVINTNSSASIASNNLGYAASMMTASLNRLSSGSRIVTSSDDAGGLAVSLKLAAAASRDSDVQNNLSNANSFAQTQDGALQMAGAILDRISQLATLYQDPTKNATDLANYADEFTQLQAELNTLGGQSFNGVSLFATSAGQSIAVATSEDLSTNSTVAVSQQNLLGSISAAAFSPLTDNFANLNNWSDQSFGSGSPTISDPSGTYVSLNTTGDDFAVAQSNQSFSGAFELGLVAQNGSGSPGAFHVQIGDSDLADLSLTSSPETIRIVADGSGNATTYVNGTQVGTQSGVPTSGSLALVNQSIGATSIRVSNLSMTSTATASSNFGAVASAANLGSLSIATVTGALQDVATMRAVNGAEQSRLNFASTLLTTNQTNLRSAISSISDVDVAAETTNLARWNVLVQAGASMLSQANQSSQVALKLIES